MALNTPVPNIINTIGLFTAAPPNWSRRMNALSAGEPAIGFSAGAATLYGVNHPGTQSATRAFRFIGDGTTVTFTLPNAAAGIVYPTTIGTSLTVVNYLETIALSFAPQYQVNALVRQRVGSDVAPTGTQFRINGVTVLFGTAPALGQVIEILIPDPATIFQPAGGVLVASTPTLIVCRSFMTAGVAPVVVQPAAAR